MPKIFHKKTGNFVIDTNEVQTPVLLRILSKALKTKENRIKLYDSTGVEVSKVTELNEENYYYKDIGPQVPWKTVFLVEYTAPLLFAFLFALWTGKLLFANICFMAHYIKRLIETEYVHIFSNATMPQINLFKNTGYYGGFAILILYYLHHDLYQYPNVVLSSIGFVLFIIGEVLNGYCHYQLKEQRLSASTRQTNSPRVLPTGLFFNKISCPNYFFEFISWVGFTLQCGVFMSAVFTIVGGVQMYIWALNKHKRYIKIFNGENGQLKYPKKWVMFPLIA